MRFRLNESVSNPYQDNIDRLRQYAQRHPHYFNSMDRTSLYDAINNLSEEGVIVIPDEYAQDPENVTDAEAEKYIKDLVSNMRAIDILRLKYVTLEESMRYYPQDYDNIELEYRSLDIGDDHISWTYAVGKKDLYNFIFEDCITEEDFPAAFDDEFDPSNKEDWNSFVNWLEDNFDEVFSKYENDILEHYEDSAREDAQENYDPRDYIDWDSMPGGHDDYMFDESINEGEDMKFKLVEAAESKICCICKKPFDGYGNNADPVCSGSCCDECNMKEVIPARLNMLDNSSSEDLDEAVLNETDESGNDEMDANCADCAAVITIPVDHDGPAYCANCMKNHLNEAVQDYTITYYLSTATRERRPETRADIDHDFKIVSVDDIDNDFDAMKYAFMLHNNLDEADVDYEVADQDINSVEDFIEYFDDRDWGDGSIIILKVEGPNGVVYDTGYDKQSFIDVYNENEKYDREMLDRLSEEDPDAAEQVRKVIYGESVEDVDTLEDIDAIEDITAEVIEEECDDDYTFEALDESMSNDISIKRLNHIFGVE